MKILQVIHDFLPKHQAGSELYTYHLSKELSKRHRVHLLFTESDPDQQQYTVKTGTYDGLPYTEIINNHMYSTFEETYDNPFMEKIFEEVLEKQCPDIVHFQHLLNLSIDFPSIAKKRNIPTVFTIHDYWLTCPSVQRLKGNLDLCFNPEECTNCVTVKSMIRRSMNLKLQRFMPIRILKNKLKRLKKLFHGIEESLIHGIVKIDVGMEMQKRRDHIRKVCGDVDLFIAPSQFLREDMIRFGISEERIIYSDYGFPNSFFKTIEHVQTDKIRFTYIGTIIPHKGVHILVEAFNQIDSPKAELHIYGELSDIPDYSQSVQAMAKNPNIKFHGRMNHEQLGEILARTDALVVPSIWFENSPLTIHEAFQAGVPVITSNIGGMAELIEEGKNGLLFNVGNPRDLEMKLKTIIDRPQILPEFKHFPKIKTIEEDVNDIEIRYKELTNSSKNSTS